MTTVESSRSSAPSAADVYAPQQDTELLRRAVRTSGVVVSARVLEVCTGSGAVAAAVRYAARATEISDCDVDVRLGSFREATALDRFDVVLCNPPYVPSRHRLRDRAQYAPSA